jgi:hypothetical protein
MATKDTFATNHGEVVSVPPPPAYHDAQSTPAQTIAELTTLDGKLSISHAYNVVHVAAVGPHERKVLLKEQNNGNQEFTVTFEMRRQSATFEMTTPVINEMALRLGDGNRSVEATARLPHTDNVLGIVMIGRQSTKILAHQSSASIRSSQAAAAKGNAEAFYFEVGDLRWQLSKNYLHAGKGKSRAGDLELVNRDGAVVAVFLNHWSGDPNATDLGQLYLTTQLSIGSAGGPLALAILSGLIVVLHMSYRDRDGFKGLVKDFFTAGAMMCAVM